MHIKQVRNGYQAVLNEFLVPKMPAIRASAHARERVRGHAQSKQRAKSILYWRTGSMLGHINEAQKVLGNRAAEMRGRGDCVLQTQTPDTKGRALAWLDATYVVCPIGNGTGSRVVFVIPGGSRALLPDAAPRFRRRGSHCSR